MLQQIISYLDTLDPWLICVTLIFFSFIENLFPPSPSDVVIIIGATLLAKTTTGFIPILLLTSLGSAIGFSVMYFLGRFLGEKLVRSGRLKFITKPSLDKADSFFQKYGYNVILANRFLPGTRAIVSFFCGVHKLKPMRTFAYAAVSSFIWNAFLIFLGVMLGKNLSLIDHYLARYSQIVLSVMVIAITALLIRFWMKKRSNG